MQVAQSFKVVEIVALGMDPPDLNTLYRQAETCCDHPNLPGADECELCLASLTHEETTPAEARARIERILYGDLIEYLAKFLME